MQIFLFPQIHCAFDMITFPGCSMAISVQAIFLNPFFDDSYNQEK